MSLVSLNETLDKVCGVERNPLVSRRVKVRLPNSDYAHKARVRFAPGDLLRNPVSGLFLGRVVEVKSEQLLRDVGAGWLEPTGRWANWLILEKPWRSE